MRARRVVALLNPVGWAVVVALLLVWQLLVDTGIWQFDYLPAPSGLIAGLGDIAGDGELWTALSHTLGIAVLSTLIAVAIGTVLGATMGRIAVFRTLFSGTFDTFRSLPVVALMPVVLLVWGPVGESELIAAAYAAVWPIAVNTAGAVQSTHPRLFDTAATLHLSNEAKFRKIMLPAALPGIVVGTRIGMVTALVVAIVAEMLINPAGLGWALVTAQQSLDANRMWAWIAVCAAVGVCLNAVLMSLARRMTRGIPSTLSGANS